MTGTDIQYLKLRVEANSLLLTALTKIVVGVTERAIDLGAFHSREMALRSDCEQLLAFVRDQQKDQAELLALFDLPT